LASELELKAVVPDPAALRRALQVAGARETFRGMLRDRRLDLEGRLHRLDQMLRVREWIHTEGVSRAVVSWKGPSSVSLEGYKHSEEIEYDASNAAAALAAFDAMGYLVIHAIDRYVEVYELAGSVARLEWYPRLDVLLEIEGPPAGIEQLIAGTGMPRGAFLPDSLRAFAARYEARTGHPAVLAESGLGDELPTWVAA
jgi:adenylate cyclase class IV